MYACSCARERGARVAVLVGDTRARPAKTPGPGRGLGGRRPWGPAGPAAAAAAAAKRPGPAYSRGRDQGGRDRACRRNRRARPAPPAPRRPAMLNGRVRKAARAPAAQHQCSARPFSAAPAFGPSIQRSTSVRRSTSIRWPRRNPLPDASRARPPSRPPHVCDAHSPRCCHVTGGVTGGVAT